MQFDFWRAAGITAGAMVASMLLWTLTYPLWAVSVPAFVAKDSILTVLIAAGFAWAFFQKVSPGAGAGFRLGLFMFFVPLALSFAFGVVDAIVGVSPIDAYLGSDLPAWYMIFSFFLTVPLIATTTLTGWYLAKKN